MAKNYENGNRFTVRLDDESDRLLTAFASKHNISRSKGVREAIKQAANDTSIQRIADQLELLSELPAIQKNIEKLSTQLNDMASTNSTNTDRITTVLKALLERNKS